MNLHKYSPHFNRIIAKILLMSSTLLLFIAVPTAINIFQQGEIFTRRIQGKIVDQNTGYPLEGVTIVLDESTNKIVSMDNGDFFGITSCLNSCDVEKILVKKSGYVSKYVDIGRKNKNVVLDISLKPIYPSTSETGLFNANVKTVSN